MEILQIQTAKEEQKMKNGSIGRRFGILFLFIVLFLLSPGTSHSNPDLPDDNLAYPVLIVNKAGGSGSGFFYNKDNAIYLITARHVLFKETSVRVPEKFAVPKALRHKFFCNEDKVKKEFILTFSGVMTESDKDVLIKTASRPRHFSFKEAIEKLYIESQELNLRNDKITLLSYVPKRFDGKGINEMELQLIKLYGNGQIRYHPSHDIACIKLGFPQKVEKKQKLILQEGVTKKRGTGIIGVAKDNFKLFKDVLVGNQVFVFGYPTSITKINPWMDIRLPLLRKGIVAGKNDLLKVVILDCPVFYGNSGGLVVEVERTQFKGSKYRAIGLVTNFVPYKQRWFENSGYSVVVPLDFVEELVALWDRE